MNYISVGPLKILPTSLLFHSVFDKIEKILKNGAKENFGWQGVSQQTRTPEEGGHRTGENTCLVPHMLVQKLQEEISNVKPPSVLILV